MLSEVNYESSQIKFNIVMICIFLKKKNQLCIIVKKTIGIWFDNNILTL